MSMNTGCGPGVRGRYTNAGISRRLPSARSKGRESHQLGRHELQGIERACLAFRVTHHRVALDLEHEHVAWRLRAFQRQRQPLARAIERDAADPAFGQRWQRLGAFRQVQHRQAAHAVGVRYPGEEAAVVGARETLDVPGNVAGEDFDRAGHQVDAPQLFELAVAVGDEVDAAAIGREARAGDAGRLAALADRRQRRGRDVHDVQVRLVRRHVVIDE
jgi:hypothetical protein